MPRFRSDIAAISPYVPGRSIDEVAAEIGIKPDEIVKLASNESPEGPFPGVIEAAARALAESNRYPDNDHLLLTDALARWLEVPGEHFWFGNGSVGLLGHTALATGGPGTSAVYAWPSFIMYRIASRWAMSEAIEVPLDEDHVHDLDAIAAAIRDDTTIVYLCNPNNPTGTIVSADAMGDFIASVPKSVLIVIDEAYHEFVTDETYATAIPHAIERPNVIVLRTFSKVFALAAHRIGYGVGRPETIAELRKAQAPFTVNQIAQVAAAASLRDRGELVRRIEANEAARHQLLGVLTERSLPHTESQANFVFFELGLDGEEAATKFTERGVIVRPMGGRWLRVTIGIDHENRRFVEALDGVLSGL
ncbi:MAG: histidinol-phosphate transaminase [Acidimicrobiia bacterium]